MLRECDFTTASTSGVGLGIARAIAEAGTDVMLNRFEATMRELGRIDILVDNAGIQYALPVDGGWTAR
jgi:NAD(P)-dependent dehydrogenase (short-subunit alcohol dehydrogenase family)